MKTMKRLFGIVLMLMVGMVVKAQVVVAIGEFKGGTIVEKSQDGQTVTNTVTPATDYYIAKSGVMKGFGTSSSDDASDSGDDSAELIAGDFIHIYNGVGLLKDGHVVDLVNGGT